MVLIKMTFWSLLDLVPPQEKKLMMNGKANGARVQGT